MATYVKVRNELIKNKQIVIVKVKPQGKNYLYKITKKGEYWLADFKKQTESLNKFSIKRRFPFTFSSKNMEKPGSVELELFSSAGTSKETLRNMESLARSPELNNLILRLMYDSINISKKRDSNHDDQYSVDTGLLINVKSKIPKKMMSTLHFVEKFEELEKRWYTERDLIFEMFFKRAITNRRILELLCSIDFFCSRPEALMECFFISGGIVSDKNRPLFSKLIREEYQSDPAVYGPVLAYPLSLFLFSKFKWPLLDPTIRKQVIKTWLKWVKKIAKRYTSISLLYPENLYEKYPRYQPDYRIKVGKRIFDFSKYKFLVEYINDSKNSEVIKWINQTIQESENKSWFRNHYHLRPWEIAAGVPKIYSRTNRHDSYNSSLIDYETFDTDATLDMVNFLSLLLYGQNPNPKLKTLELVFLKKVFLERYSGVSDSEWFNVWPFLDSLKKSTIIHESFLIKPLQELYDKWNFSKKSNITYNFGLIIKIYFGLIKRRSEFTLSQKTRNNLRNKIIDIVNETVFE
ncbi:MAG: hypothetical protein QXW91_00870 [Candidatus Nitrosotenuis sp.]